MHIEKLMVDSRLEVVKILVIREISSRESFSQSNTSWEEVIWVELQPYHWNTKVMRISTLYTCMAGLSCEGLNW